MSTFRHIYYHWRQYGNSHRPLYAMAFMILLFAVFDGMTSYITPLLITEKGISKTAMGFILGSSSLAGALFDFFLAKVLKNPHFRRVFLMMFVVAAI